MVSITHDHETVVVIPWASVRGKWFFQEKFMNEVRSTWCLGTPLVCLAANKYCLDAVKASIQSISKSGQGPRDLAKL